MQAHPFFAGVDWETLHASMPPYMPRVEHELDTQNFEHFDEDMQSQVNQPAICLRLARESDQAKRLNTCNALVACLLIGSIAAACFCVHCVQQPCACMLSAAFHSMLHQTSKVFCGFKLSCGHSQKLRFLMFHSFFLAKRLHSSNGQVEPQAKQ